MNLSVENHSQCRQIISNTFVPFFNICRLVTFKRLLFFYLGFVLRTFTNHWTAGEGGGHFFNSSLPPPPASQTLRHQPGDYCRELISAHSQQSDSNREPLVSKRKSLTTMLRALIYSKKFKKYKLNALKYSIKFKKQYSTIKVHVIIVHVIM